jgi:putative ABC transport system permease protein
VFPYYLKLSYLSLVKYPVITAMLVTAIGLGIGASMTMITVVHVMTRDPAPTISDRLFYPFIDASRPGWQGRGGANLTRTDAFALLKAHKADKQAAMSGGRALVEPPDGRGRPFYANGRFVTSEFFSMFEAPFGAGAGWTPDKDEGRDKVVVLGAELAAQLFGASDPMGASVRLDSQNYRVIGVLADWRPQPLFYGGLSGEYAFGGSDQFFSPLQTALEQKSQFVGGMSCWENTDSPRQGDQCKWLQFWVRLDSAEKRTAYLEFLGAYWRDQQQHGRMLRSPQPRVDPLMERLRQLELVPDDVARQLLLAQLFLLVCLLNATGLLLATFLQMMPQICIRRALGARRQDIFVQLMCEAAIVGALGGVLGGALAALGVWLIRAQPDRYAQLARLDANMVAFTLCLAVLSSLLAAGVPAWRACRAAPALELKLQ